MPKRFQSLDNATGIYFERELEHVMARTFEVKYQDLEFRKLFFVNHEVDPAAETITGVIYDAVGTAKIISAYASDLPRSDVKGREFSYPVRSTGTSFGYTFAEIRAAKYQRRPLKDMKAKACRRASEQLLNDIAFNGDAESDLPGFFNHPNIPVANVVNPGGGTEWVNKTPDQILFDVNDMFSDVVELTKKVEKPRVLVLPVKQWNYIATTRIPDTNMTIMSFLIANSPWLTSQNQIISINELAGIGAGGTDVMYAYDPSPEKLEMHVPMELMFHPPQEKGLEMLVPAEGRTGGVHVYYPLSVTRREGI